RMQAAQSEDGSWPLYHGGPGHLSTTIEAYFGMKLAGTPADHPAMRRAREFIRAHGGLERALVLTRTFLAYFVQYPWAGVPAMRARGDAGRAGAAAVVVPAHDLRDGEVGAGDRRAADGADGEAAALHDPARVRGRGAVARSADPAERRLPAQRGVAVGTQPLP